MVCQILEAWGRAFGREGRGANGNGRRGTGTSEDLRSWLAYKTTSAEATRPRLGEQAVPHGGRVHLSMAEARWLRLVPGCRGLRIYYSDQGGDPLGIAALVETEFMTDVKLARLAPRKTKALPSRMSPTRPKGRVGAQRAGQSQNSGRHGTPGVVVYGKSLGMDIIRTAAIPANMIRASGQPISRSVCTVLRMGPHPLQPPSSNNMIPFGGLSLSK